MKIDEKKHILIVDDDDRIRELTKQYLQSNNFYTTTAKNSNDAKNKIKLIKSKKLYGNLGYISTCFQKTSR